MAALNLGGLDDRTLAGQTFGIVTQHEGITAAHLGATTEQRWPVANFTIFQPEVLCRNEYLQSLSRQL